MKKPKLHKELEKLYQNRLKELINVKVRIFPCPGYREEEHQFYFVVEFINTITEDVVGFRIKFEDAIELTKKK